MNSLTRLKKKWHRELKRFFIDNQISRCESCQTSEWLTVMHAMKQRFCTTETAYKRAALICQREHHFWEYGDKDNPGTHERMAAFVDEIIERRRTL